MNKCKHDFNSALPNGLKICKVCGDGRMEEALDENLLENRWMSAEEIREYQNLNPLKRRELLYGEFVGE